MNQTSLDIATLLEAQSVGTKAATSGWGIYTSRQPDSPNTVITIYDSGGFEANPKFLLDTPTIQVRVRGNVGDYQGGYDKILQVKNELLGIPQQTIGGTVYVGIWAIADILFLQYDDKKRPIFVNNWRITREPADESPSTHRVPLGG